jgi:hypothetical protein
MKKARNISTAGAICVLGMIPYFFLLKALGDPRVADNALTWEDANWLESMVFLFGGISIFILWFYALCQAYRAGRMGWLIGIFFFWPVYPIYFWKFTEE